MKPYYERDGITIYHGDCREIIPSMEIDESITVLVTDPPYGLLNTFGTSDLHGSRTMQFDMDRGGDATQDVMEALQIAFPSVNAFHLFCSPEQFGGIAEYARQSGFTPKAWARLKLAPPPPMQGNWWPSAFELAMYGYRPGAWFGDNGAKRKNTYTADGYRHGIRASEKTGHPTQKWLPMIQYIVGCIVPPEGVALDPFMGGGTTLRASKNLGRKAIGIEIEERWCAAAVKCLLQEAMQLS